jgi:hypothetical protein
MPSVLASIPLHNAFAPLILIIGIVMAIRQRSRVGIRAVRFLVIGAGLLLLLEAFAFGRSLLRDSIAHPGDVRFGAGAVGDITVAVAVTNGVLYAAGIGLLVAAVFERARFTAAGQSTAEADTDRQPEPSAGAQST